MSVVSSSFLMHSNPTIVDARSASRCLPYPTVALSSGPLLAPHLSLCGYSLHVLIGNGDIRRRNNEDSPSRRVRSHIYLAVVKDSVRLLLLEDGMWQSKMSQMCYFGNIVISPPPNLKSRLSSFVSVTRCHVSSCAPSFWVSYRSVSQGRDRLAPKLAFSRLL